MESLFNLNQPGFSRFISASFVLHIVILVVALFVVHGPQKKVFISPAYTKVNLIAASPEKGDTPTRATRKAHTKAKKPVKKTIIKKKKTIPAKKAKPTKKTKHKTKIKIKKKKVRPPKAKPKEIKKEAIAIKKAVPPPPLPAVQPLDIEKKISVDEAISRLERQVTKDDHNDFLSERIDRLKRKTAMEDKKKKRELDELRRELSAYDEAKKIVSAEAPPQSHTKKSNSANAYEGLSDELLDLQFRSYYNKVGVKIQSLWIYPGAVKEELETLITIKIDRSGALLDYWVEKRSGMPKFDDSALKAVAKAAPFPPLPIDYNEDNIEIGLRFCPGGCVGKK